MKSIEKTIQSQIARLQETYNFDPSQGIGQIGKAPTKLRDAYVQFRTLVDLARQHDIEVKANDGFVAKEPEQESVYLCHRKGTSEWKVGYSKSVRDRIASLTTGSAGTLTLACHVPGGRDFEQAILRYLQPLRIPGRSKEWVYLDKPTAKHVITMMKQGPQAFTGTISLG